MLNNISVFLFMNFKLIDFFDYLNKFLNYYKIRIKIQIIIILFVSSFYSYIIFYNSYFLQNLQTQK